MNKLFKILPTIAGLALTAAFGTAVVLARSERLSPLRPMLLPGDRIGNMTLSTGVEQAYQLWSFCSEPVQKENLTSVDCEVPVVSRLALGYPFGIPDEQQEWSDLDWELTLDDQPVDLYAFGTYHLVFPSMAARPSPIREVFRSVQVWDVVLENPAAGAHTIRGSAHVDGQSYTWDVNFSVASSSN